MIQELENSQKLYHCRDTAKRFFREEFPKKLEPYTDLIQAVMKANKIEVIPALLEISKTETYQENGMGQMMFMAATVELLENDNEKANEKPPTTVG
jgi:hypothetical protein